MKAYLFDKETDRNLATPGYDWAKDHMDANDPIGEVVTLLIYGSVFIIFLCLLCYLIVVLGLSVSNTVDYVLSLFYSLAERLLKS